MPSRSQATRWRALKRRKGREEHGLFIAEGPRVIAELLRSPSTVRHLLHTSEAAADPAAAELLRQARDGGVEVEEVAVAELAEFADTVNPQGLLAVAEIPRRSREQLGDRLLILDAVQDPGNAGTLLRTAEALALEGVLSMPGTVDIWNPKVVRASAGSAFRIPVLDSEWEETATWLEETDTVVWVADASGDPVNARTSVPDRLALVLGNESRGASEQAGRIASRRVAVPLRGPVESLNVAVAAAILMDRLFSRGRSS